MKQNAKTNMNSATRNEIYLQKRLKLILPVPEKNSASSDEMKLFVATFGKNIENLGYVFSPKLIRSLQSLSINQVESLYLEILPILRKMRGAHRRFRPMYPNFPKQVMDMSNFELYWNAMLHYWSFNMLDLGLVTETWLPKYEKDERLPLTETVKYDMIDLGYLDDFNNIFTKLVEAKSSISDSDKEIIRTFVMNYCDGVRNLLPSTISTKEQVAFLAGLLIEYTNISHLMRNYVKTPTDVLRIAVSFSGGDVSLAEVTKFKNFRRSVRRFLLELLENCKTNLSEEMVKYQSRWIRLGEFLHPFEYRKQFPRAADAFDSLRNEKVRSFNSSIELGLKEGDVSNVVKKLINRPGDFARRLDHIFRTSRSRSKIAKQFLEVADKVSTPVLLQVFTHFKNRGESNFRAVFPKGNVAKIHVLENNVKSIDRCFCNKFSESVRGVLVNRFSKLSMLGKVFLDENLENYLVPFSQRSASKALKTIVRGSKIPLDGDYDTLRFFIWWKDSPNGRTDIDLSASILNERFIKMKDIAYYNLKDFGGCHSGDITSAPNGASEFIDISLSKVLENGGRYIAMQLYSFTMQPYCDLPECFAGWMGRKSPQSGEIFEAQSGEIFEAQSGEIFEAKTVKNKIDIASNTTICIPLLIDALERKVIWVDLGLKNSPTWNNARNNSNSVSLICKAMSDLKKTTLYDLLSMHVEARGTKVSNKKSAKVVFDEETTPYDIDTILTEYL